MPQEREDAQLLRECRARLVRARYIMGNRAVLICTELILQQEGRAQKAAAAAAAGASAAAAAAGATAESKVALLLALLLAVLLVPQLTGLASELTLLGGN